MLYIYGKSDQVPPGDKLGAYNDEFIDIGLELKPDICGNIMVKNYWS